MYVLYNYTQIYVFSVDFESAYTQHKKIHHTPLELFFDLYNNVSIIFCCAKIGEKLMTSMPFFL